MSINLTIKKRGVIKKIALWIALFLTIYGYECFLANGNRIDNGGKYKLLIDVLTIVCSLLLILFLLFRKIAIDKSFALMLAMCICILASMLWNSDYTAGMILKMMMIVSGYAIVKIYGIKEFCTAFVKIMKFFAICSLITYLCGIFAFPIVQKFPTVLMQNRLGISGAIANLGISSIPYYEALRYRNYGVFREPGVYQAFLNVALLFQLFFVNLKASKKSIIIFSVAIISTLSTAGIAAWLIIMLCYLGNFERKQDKIGSKAKILVSILVIIAISIVLFIPDIYSIVFSKFTSGGASWYSRMNSISSNIHVFLSSPIFGVGMTQLDSLLQGYLYSINLSAYMHNTNTVFTEFSIYGFLFGMMYLYGLFVFVKRVSNNNLVRILLGTAMIALLFGENFDTTFLFSIILFLGFDKREGGQT